MEIHELNNFSGSLDANAYVAVDNTSDTGKITYTEFVAPVKEYADEEVADLKAEKDEEVTDLKSDINHLIDGTGYGAENTKGGNLFPFKTDVIDGGYYSISDGSLSIQSNANYYGFILKVKPNTDYICTFYRFLVLLEDDKETAIGSLLSSYTTFNTGTAEYVAISFDKTQYPVSSYIVSEGSVRDSSPFKIDIPWLYHAENAAKLLPNGAYAEASNPSASESLEVLSYNNCVKYDKSLVYMAHSTNAIGNVTIYHQGSNPYGVNIQITPTNVIVTNNGSTVLNEAHGITIQDYLYVFVDTDDQNNATIKVMSNGTIKTYSVTSWYGWKGQVFALCSSALDYHSLRWTCKRLDSPIWIFGDSYLSKTSQERWGYYLKDMGFDNWLACGYPGAPSANVVQNVANLLAISKPKYIVWMLGMNDPDNGAINASWLSCVQSVIALCEQYDITPILTKIPTANGAGTLYDHSYKNAWIEASGHRYIDFPSAVGADSSGDWYTGLLANDGIHPSWRGAQALAYQVLTDLPEIMEEN